MIGLLLGSLMFLAPSDQPVVVSDEPRIEEAAAPARPLHRCDGQIEICADVNSPWPDADMVTLCQVKQWACRYVEAAPVAVLAAHAGRPWGDLSDEQRKVGVIVWFTFQNHPTTTPEAALKVSACESGWQHGIRNGSGSSATGVFQWLRADWAWYTGRVMGASEPASGRLDPVLSAAVTAHRVEREGGWRAWSCKP